MKDHEEARLQKEAERGAHAERLLSDSLLQEAFQKLEERIIEMWRDAPIRDTEGQQLLLVRMRTLDEIRKHIETIAKTGRLSMEMLERERTLRERVKDKVRALRR